MVVSHEACGHRRGAGHPASPLLRRKSPQGVPEAGVWGSPSTLPLQRAPPAPDGHVGRGRGRGKPQRAPLKRGLRSVSCPPAQCELPQRKVHPGGRELGGRAELHPSMASPEEPCVLGPVVSPQQALSPLGKRGLTAVLSLQGCGGNQGIQNRHGTPKTGPDTSQPACVLDGRLGLFCVVSGTAMLAFCSPGLHSVGGGIFVNCEPYLLTEPACHVSVLRSLWPSVRVSVS